MLLLQGGIGAPLLAPQRDELAESAVAKQRALLAGAHKRLLGGVDLARLVLRERFEHAERRRPVRRRFRREAARVE